MKKVFSLVALLLAGSFLFSSCTVTPIPTPTPTQTPESSPTLTPIPTLTSVPTPTPTQAPGSFSTLSLSECITQAGTAIDPQTESEYRTANWPQGTMETILRETRMADSGNLTPRSFRLLEDKYNQAILSAWSNAAYYDTYSERRVIPSYIDVSIDEINEAVPIEHLANLSDGWIAAIFRITEEDCPDALMGITFGSVQRYNYVGTEGWSIVGEPCFFPLTGPLASTDYDYAQIGDPIEKLCEIDPSICYDTLHAETRLTAARKEQLVDRAKKSMEEYPDSKEVNEKYIAEIDVRTIYKVTTDGVICLKYNDQTRQITGKTVYLAANGQHCTTQARVYIGYSGRRPEVFFVPEEGHAVAVVPYDASFLAPLFS